MGSSAHRKISFSRPVLAGAEAQAVAAALEAGAFTGRGPNTPQTEGRLSAMQGNSPVLLTKSGSTALLAALLALLALLAFRLRPGDEVIILSFSFVAVAQAVVLAGGVSETGGSYIQHSGGGRGNRHERWPNIQFPSTHRGVDVENPRLAGKQIGICRGIC